MNRVVAGSGRVARRQTRNLYRLARRQPLTEPQLVSQTLDADDVAVASRWLRDRSGWDDDTTVARYTQEFARWNGSRAAFAFQSGRVALSACIAALGLQPGDEAILPGYTCVVVPNAFEYAGVRPVFADIELETFGPDVTSVERLIGPRTRAILVHHLYGLVCRDYQAVLDLARARGLRVIEDCAHATGASFRGTRVGNRGDVGFYSSEQSKIFNTIQGGVAVTNDDTLSARLSDYYERAARPAHEAVEAQLRNVFLHFYQLKHPRRWLLSDFYQLRYGSSRLTSTTREEELGIRPKGYGLRMPSPVAALGLNQLLKIDAYNEQRRLTALHWKAWATGQGFPAGVVIEGSVPTPLRFPILVEPEMKQNPEWAFRTLGLRPGVWFLGTAHPIDRDVGDCPNAREAVARCVNLPTLMDKRATHSLATMNRQAIEDSGFECLQN